MTIRALAWPCKTSAMDSLTEARGLVSWVHRVCPATCSANTSSGSARVSTIDPITDVPLSTVSKTGMLSVPAAGQRGQLQPTAAPQARAGGRERLVVGSGIVAPAAVDHPGHHLVLRIAIQLGAATTDVSNYTS
jgi:hypothetical protein